MNSNRLADLDLRALVENCIQESSRFRAGQLGEEGHCFELFRRAVDEHDQDAWSALYTQYYYLVLMWIGDHPESAELVETTFTRFWHTLDNQHLAHRFEHVGAVLAYLRKCANSARIDLERQQKKQGKIPWIPGDAWYDHDVENRVAARLDRDELCAGVRRWLEANVSDRQEQQIIFFSYDLDLSPAEIACRYPEQFASVQEVRKIKERVLKRLHRSGGLEQLLRH